MCIACNVSTEIAIGDETYIAPMDCEIVELKTNRRDSGASRQADHQECPLTLPPLKQVMAELESADPTSATSDDADVRKRRSLSDPFMANVDFPPRGTLRRASVTADHSQIQRWSMVHTTAERRDSVCDQDVWYDETRRFSAHANLSCPYDADVMGASMACQVGSRVGLHAQNSTPVANQYWRQPALVTRPLRLLPGLAPAVSRRNNVRFEGYGQVDGETVYMYTGGYYLPTQIDGEPVNALWGLTKANTPRKRLATACDRCRLKKTRCEPQPDGCPQCQRVGEVCHMSFNEVAVINCYAGV